MPYAHCYKELSVPNASLVQGIISALATYASLLQCSLLQGIISALCLPVTAARHHQFPMPPCHCCKASSVPYASLLQGPLLQGLISALCLPVARLTAASSPPSLLSLRALCYYSLYTVLCWSVFYTRDGLVWSVFYTPTVWSGLVWSGLCFIPNRLPCAASLVPLRGKKREWGRG